MNPSTKSSLPTLLAFGAASAAGLVAAVLLAPASGHHVRTRMAARLHSWTKLLTGRGHAHAHSDASQAPGSTGTAAGANLAMHPDHLLANR
jgi:gas vesicle protein